MFTLDIDTHLKTKRGVSGVSESAHLQDMRNIGLPSKMKKILHNYQGSSVEFVLVDEASYFGTGQARRHRPPSPDIDHTHVRLHRLGLAKNSLAPDLPRCTAAHSTVVLSRSTAPGMGVALRL